MTLFGPTISPIFRETGQRQCRERKSGEAVNRRNLCYHEIAKGNTRKLENDDGCYYYVTAIYTSRETTVVWVRIELDQKQEAQKFLGGLVQLIARTMNE
jgi:hypothetical protein